MKPKRYWPKHWKPFIEHPNTMPTDATCYETAMRYPANVELLWESVDWCYGQLKLTCKYLKIRTLRTKYLKQKQGTILYAYIFFRKGRISKKFILTKGHTSILNRVLIPGWAGCIYACR